MMHDQECGLTCVRKGCGGTCDWVSIHNTDDGLHLCWKHIKEWENSQHKEEKSIPMVKAIYAGSFDPITLGHLDVIQRSMQICTELIIGIGINPAKKTLFTEEERIKQINQAINSQCDFLLTTYMKVIPFQGLLVDFAKEMGATVLIRGIRSVSDFEYEMTVAQANRMLVPEIETFFVPTRSELAVVSSSTVKEIAKFGGDISKFTTKFVADALKSKFAITGNSVTDTCLHCSKSGCLKWTDDKPSFRYCRECGKVV